MDKEINIWTTPYKKLPWKHRWFMQPLIMSLELGIWLLKKIESIFDQNRK